MKVAAASVMTADIPNVRDFWSGLVDSVGPICPADRKVIMFSATNSTKIREKLLRFLSSSPASFPSDFLSINGDICEKSCAIKYEKSCVIKWNFL